MASESDERVLKVLKEGPKSLAQAWMLQSMRYKYGGRYISDTWGFETPLFHL